MKRFIRTGAAALCVLMLLSAGAMAVDANALPNEPVLVPGLIDVPNNGNINQQPAEVPDNGDINQQPAEVPDNGDINQQPAEVPNNGPVPGEVPSNNIPEAPLPEMPLVNPVANTAWARNQRVVLADPAPWNVSELKKVINVQDPAQVAAYYVWAVNRLVWNYDEGMGMMKYLFADIEVFGRGYTEGGLSGRGGWDVYMDDRLPDPEWRWLPRAYLAGATAQNGFVPTRPITIELEYNKANTESINSKGVEAVGRASIVYRVKSSAGGNLVEIVVTMFEGSNRWYVTNGSTAPALFYDQRGGVSQTGKDAAKAVDGDGATAFEHNTKYGTPLPFVDVAGTAYYYDAVNWAYKTGVTTGASATAFGPELSCTRGQAVTFLWRAAGKPEPGSTNNPFTDVKETDYFYKPVLWALEKGITAGTSAELFSPGQVCSSAHIITFLYRAKGIGADGWYQEAEKWAVGEGLLDGTGVTVSPQALCPRGAMVTFLYRSYGK